MRKRHTAGLIPYIWKDDNLLIFLQKRDVDAISLPDQFGFFGGGLDKGETPEQALVREIEEELEYTPETFTYLDRYENDTVVMDVYYEKVSESFENDVIVHEGQYGTFMLLDKALAELTLADTYQHALIDLKKELITRVE